MSMYNAIKEFPQQFLFEPAVEHEKKLKKYKHYIVCGMGGSHLSADLLKIVKPKLSLHIHKSYGLPNLPDDVLKKSLIITVSYSGNTEETIDAYQEAKKHKLPIAAIAIGGKLLETAKHDKVPYVQLPSTGIQPRSAAGFMFMALLALLKDEYGLEEAKKLADSLTDNELSSHGKKIADEILGRVPIIYASQQNAAIAENWKIKFNETGKIPAFYNVFPELNHNEMTGFDVIERTRDLSERFCFIFLHDKQDHPKIQRRFMVTKQLYQQRNLPVIDITLEEGDNYYKIFRALTLADWTAYCTANLYDAESEQVPMVEEFKKLIS